MTAVKATRVSTYVEHVLHVVGWDERVVDGGHLKLRLVASSAKDQAANATEAVDTNLDGGPKCTNVK